MNPYTDSSETAAPDVRNCSQCRDMGFILPPEFHGASSGIPAGVLYRYGVPCSCAAGIDFRCRQAEWNKPILPHVPARNITEVPGILGPMTGENPAKWPAPPWSDPPRKPPQRATAAQPIHRVTQEEIDRIKARQEANRKERQL